MTHFSNNQIQKLFIHVYFQHCFGKHKLFHKQYHPNSQIPSSWKSVFYRLFSNTCSLRKGPHATEGMTIPCTRNTIGENCWKYFFLYGNCILYILTTVKNIFSSFLAHWKYYIIWKWNCEVKHFSSWSEFVVPLYYSLVIVFVYYISNIILIYSYNVCIIWKILWLP